MGWGWSKWIALFKPSYWSLSPWDTEYYGLDTEYHQSDSAVLHRQYRYGKSLDYG